MLNANQTEPATKSITVDNEVLLQHLRPLEAFVNQRMGNLLAERESTEDIVQSVCRELLSAKGDLQFPTNEALHGWLRTAATHKIMQKARHYRSQRRAALREVADAHGSQIRAQGDAVTPSRDASAREEVERFEDALSNLSQVDREIIIMIKLAGLTHEEASQKTGRTVVASRTLLRRALIRLSALLTSEED
jgi:RNA polymerase sigma-70 factor, ECF subfamily